MYACSSLMKGFIFLGKIVESNKKQTLQHLIKALLKLA